MCRPIRRQIVKAKRNLVYFTLNKKWFDVRSAIAPENSMLIRKRGTGKQRHIVFCSVYNKEVLKTHSPLYYRLRNIRSSSGCDKNKKNNNKPIRTRRTYCIPIVGMLDERRFSEFVWDGNKQKLIFPQKTFTGRCQNHSRAQAYPAEFSEFHYALRVWPWKIKQNW